MKPRWYAVMVSGFFFFGWCVFWMAVLWAAWHFVVRH